MTCRHVDTENAPVTGLAGIVNEFLRETGIKASVSPTYPLRLDWAPDVTALPKVSLLVASKLEGETQLSCMLSILAETAYPKLEMIVVVTQNRPLTAHQQEMADRLTVHDNVRIHMLPEPTFNYSERAE